MAENYPSGVPVSILPDQKPDEYDILSYDNVRDKLRRINSTFKEVTDRCRVERLTRNPEGVTEASKDVSDMAPGDIIIPMPLIRTTIQREQPSYIQYLVQPPRAAVIDKVGDDNFNTERLESELTRCIRYEGWNFPFIKCVDGSQTHGWAFIMPVFDISKPGHLSFQYIATDDLLFPLGVKDFQAAEYIAVRETLTLLELKDIQTAGQEELRVLQESTPMPGAAPPEKPSLNPVALKELIEHLKNGQNTSVEVFHFFCKHEGIVHHGWISLDKNVDFLVYPKPLFLGELAVEEIPEGAGALLAAQGAPMMPPPMPEKIYEKAYPIYPFIYIETEEKCFNDHRGRAALDRSKQRAQTALATAFINKELRASNVYAAVDAKSNIMGAEPKQLDVRLENGSIWNVPMTFFSSEGGSNVTLMGLQYFEASYSNESGQLNYAVANRKDSRKTAAEVKSAESEQQELNMIQVLLFALFLQGLFNTVFRVVRSRAMHDLLPFCQDPATGQNDKELLSGEYTIYPSGDVDVVERQKKVEQMMQFWPIVAATPIAPDFLASLLDYAFPDEGFGELLEQRIQAMMQDNTQQLKILLEQTFNILQKTTTEEELKVMSAEDRNMLAKLSQMVKAALAAPTPGPGMPGQPAQQGAPQPQQPQKPQVNYAQG